MPKKSTIHSQCSLMGFDHSFHQGSCHEGVETTKTTMVDLQWVRSRATLEASCNVSCPNMFDIKIIGRERRPIECEGLHGISTIPQPSG